MEEGSEVAKTQSGIETKSVVYSGERAFRKGTAKMLSQGRHIEATQKRHARIEIAAWWFPVPMFKRRTEVIYRREQDATQ
jgi:hypothetical protein